MNEFLELFEVFDTDTLSVSNLGIKVGGALVTHIRKNGNIAEVWSGDPDDKHSEQLILNETEMEWLGIRVYYLI